MKKIILLSLLTLVTTKSFSAEKVEIFDLKPTEHTYMFELKTKKFESAVLDCQSFIHNITFKQDKKIIKTIYLDIDYDNSCEDLHDYIKNNVNSKKTVCLSYEAGTNDFEVNETEDLSCI